MKVICIRLSLPLASSPGTIPTAHWSHQVGVEGLPRPETWEGEGSWPHLERCGRSGEAAAGVAVQEERSGWGEAGTGGRKLGEGGSGVGGSS